MTICKDDIAITVALLAGHIEVLNKHLDANELCAATRALYRIKSECATGIEMLNKMAVERQLIIDRKQSQQTGVLYDNNN